jgi:hypothetical protein
MKSEQELNLVADKIKRDAKKRGIDLLDPTHAFTVWVEFPDQMVYSGSCTTHKEAAALAAEHTSIQKGKLYIAMGPLSNFAVYEV